MIDNSWAWATSRGKIRLNPVHKKEEAELVLEDWFEKKAETGEDTTMSGSAVLEDRPGTSWVQHYIISTVYHTSCSHFRLIAPEG